ncbi:MAG: hypothetical protein F2536_01125 [Actinobacteria bacterium]|uniref:Unannotated protein n=1 Tax=freshwater metagenome TaxID=449393 RepID=A0A6J6BNS5_9ZZZZ|nr:hypothetical protein [Actinomycetota bacterium]MTA89515.1 hypothetical protein [Actinomycetota bacterium]
MQTLRFPDPRDTTDLRSFLARAKRLDEDGVVKFRAFGDILACYVSPIYSGSLLADGPTILGLRTIQLASPSELDSCYAIEEVLERLTESTSELKLPKETARAAWTGITPPRQGWEEFGTVSQEQISKWAKDGIEEVARTLPTSVGSAIAARVRLGIWGKTVSLEFNLPGGSAFAMAGLGFMQKDEEIKVFRTNGWVRLTSSYGHVMAKQSFKVA